jgi:hypothetical protein
MVENTLAFPTSGWHAILSGSQWHRLPSNKKSFYRKAPSGYYHLKDPQKSKPNGGTTAALPAFGTSPDPFANFTRESADALLKRVGPILKPDPEAVGTGATAYRGILSKMPGMSTEVYDKMLKQAEDSARLNMGLAMMQAGFGAAAAPRERGESTFSTLSRTLFQPLSAAAMQTMGAARKEKMAAQLGKLQAEGRLSTAAFQAAMADETTARKTLAAMLGKKSSPIKTRKADATLNIGTAERPDRKLVSTSVQTDGEGNTRIVLDSDAYGYKSGEALTQGEDQGQVTLVGKGDGKRDRFTYTHKEFVINDKVLGILTRNRIKVDPDIKGKKGTFRIAIPKPGTDGTTQFDLTVGATTFDLSKMSEKDRSALGLIEPPSADEDGSIGTQDYYLQDAEGNLKEDAKGNPQVVRFYISGKKAGQAIKQGGGEIDISGLEAVKVPSHSDLKSAAEAGYFVLVDEATGTIQHDALGFPITARQQGSIWIRPNTTEAYEPPLNTLFKPASDYFKAKPKEPDPKGILSQEFLQGNYLQAAGALGTDHSDLESVRGPLKSGQLRGTLKVDPEASVLGKFPFLMPDGTDVPENLQKPIWDSYKGLIWGRAKGAKSYSEFAPIVKAANQEFLNRSIYDMGIPLPSGRPRPEITNRTMAKDAKLASKAPGVNVADQWKNVNITAFTTGDLSKPPAKTGITVQSNPHLFRNITNENGKVPVDGERDLQQRFDLENAGRRLSFSSRNRPDEWWSDLGTTSDKIRADREARYGSEDATENIKHVQDSLNMLNEIRNFSNAMLATGGATGWIEGNFIDFLERTTGTELLKKNEDYSRLKVAGDRFISGISRKVGRQFGDLRISNYDAEDYKKMNAAMGKSVTLNKVLLDRYEKQLLNEIRNGLKNIGIANFDKRTLESAIAAGVDISGIKPKHGYYSPYFKDTFPLTNQPTPQNDDTYLQELREAGNLKRRRYKGQYLVPQVDSTTGAMLIGKPPLRFSQEQLDALNPDARKKVMGLIEMYWQKGWRELE